MLIENNVIELNNEKTPSTIVISDRSRRESPIAIELRAVNNVIDERINSCKSSSFDIFNEIGDEASDVFNTFEPKFVLNISGVLDI